RVPDRNEEYFLYQTLVGVWPAGGAQGSAYEDLIQRIKEYMLKASREAKVNTSWINPDAKYEDALLAFIEAVLSPVRKNRFLDDFLPFQRMVSRYGVFNSLSQTLLKIASPGVPDFYQGTELWDFSLVDPDNRRPVDYEKRIRMLAELKRIETEKTTAGLAQKLLLHEDDGMIKQFLIVKALHYRMARRALFERGEYAPLAAAGEKAGHVCAFVRSLDGASVIVAVPRFPTRLIDSRSMLFREAVWGDTHLALPDAGKGARFRNMITAEVVDTEQEKGEQRLPLSLLFASFPVALLEKDV
ncbi:MAG TPA: malto-oligosyltrehalose synthase, partial [Nitrospirota bacterium]